MDDTSRRLDDAERSSGRAEERIRDYAEPPSRRSDEALRSVADDPDRPSSTARDADEGSDQRVQEIRAEIEQTRDELSETIDAIQDRLRPRNIVAGATERVKTATTERVKEMANTAGETAQDVMEQTREAAGGVTRAVRENPIPAVLIGIGTAWLLMNRSGSSGSKPRSWNASDRSLGAEYRRGSRETYDYGAYGTYGDYEDRGSYEGPGSGVLERVKHHPIPAALAGVGLAWLAFSDGDDRDDYAGTNRETRGYGRGRTSGVGQDVRSAYDSAASGVSDAASGVASQAQELASQTQEYVGDAAREVRRRGRRAQNQLQRLLHDNPLLVGAAAVVLGAAVGMALPETERENEWMGEARDNMVDRAQEMARNAASRVQDAAGDVVGDVASKVVTGKDE